ncbi:MAG: PilZ domain-containing protein [Nitrospirales bacterium]
MRLPVVLTKAHQGKALEVDKDKETITLVGPHGEPLGTVTWEAVITHILGTSPPVRPVDLSGQRNLPRASLLVKVRYRTAEGLQHESRASGIGGGGLFIESSAPLPVGTELSMDFALPEHPDEWLNAKARVSWVCPKPDQYTFFPGMGVRFTEISEAVRTRVMDLVNSLRRRSQGA